MTWDQRHWLEDFKTFQNVQEHDQSLKIEQDMHWRSWEIFVGNLRKKSLEPLLKIQESKNYNTKYKTCWLLERENCQKREKKDVIPS